ncbi:MAG: hypothetical protein EAX95_01560 [Candidatus Thorarchaeota archaeon]|nr:hypothetical protein [Candidatus Thorarchaeota archaeon]
MEEPHAIKRPENVPRLLLILLLVVLLVPHTIAVTRYSYIPGEGYTRYTLIAALWSIVHESGNATSGPYITTSLAFPADAVLLWTLTILPLSLYIIHTQKRFMKGDATKRAVFHAILALLVVQVILAGFLCYSLDGWLTGCSYPVPLFQLVSLLIAIFYQR